MAPGASWTGHTFIAGRTGSGKSHHAAGLALAWAGPCLIIDRANGLSDLLGWPAATRRDSHRDIMRALLGGPGLGHLCYIPHWDTAIARAETDLLIRVLFARGPHDPALLLIVDEAWRVAREGERPGQVHRVAVEGLAAGIQLVAISQRPANVSKDLVTQCDRMVLFPTSFEQNWLGRYGIDHAEVSGLLDRAPQYSYVTWDQKTIQGPHIDPPLTIPRAR